MKQTTMSRLKDITLKIGSGATPTGGENSYKCEGITLIRSMNVYDFQFESKGLAFIDERQAAQLSNVEVVKNDILLNITGASVARCCMVPFSVLPARVNQHVAIIRIDQKKACPVYVLYCINSPHYKSTLLSIAQGGATREALTKQKIEQFEVPTPPLLTQRKIASVLSAYDDQIENNTRRIAILEEMAQRIYKEWFVNFRFPGHENAKYVDSPLGKIPEGWKVLPLKEVYKTSSGSTPSRKVDKYYQQGSINWVKTKELEDRFIWETEEKITEEGLANSSAKVFPTNTVIMAMYGATIGQLGILGAEATTNQACCGFLTSQSRYGYPYLFFNLLVNRTDIINLRTGAAQQNISQEVIREIPFLVPSLLVVQKFNDSVEPFLQSILRLQKKKVNLNRTRDLLLPKLISGQLDVENLDIDTLEPLVDDQT
jgi:type I restriction enzyme S subunit